MIILEHATDKTCQEALREMSGFGKFLWIVVHIGGAAIVAGLLIMFLLPFVGGIVGLLDNGLTWLVIAGFLSLLKPLFM